MTKNYNYLTGFVDMQVKCNLQISQKVVRISSNEWWYIRRIFRIEVNDPDQNKGFFHLKPH